MQRWAKPIAWSFAVLMLVVGVWSAGSLFSSEPFRIGVPPEFLERADGYRGLENDYELELPTVEMNAALMYDALKNERVDVAVGYSTDGRIKAFDLQVLKDDRNYFPPYDAAPLVRSEVLERNPGLQDVLNRLAGTITTETMIALNNKVDYGGKQEAAVAEAFLDSLGFETGVARNGEPDIVIGGKLQTEQFILGHMYRLLIENYTSLDAGLRMGLAGTQIVFNALDNGEIDLYPEYTGTGLHVLLKADASTVKDLGNDSQAVYDFVKEESERQFNLTWLQPIGFENTYALLMRRGQAETLGVETISDLVRFLEAGQ